MLIMIIFWMKLDILVVFPFCWLSTGNLLLVKHWCTCNTGTWYAANYTYAMTYILIKTYMIMLTQTPFHMRLWMWNTKWLCWGLVGITINFHIFVWNIRIILNMILSICPFSFTGCFPVFPLINKSIFTNHP